MVGNLSCVLGDFMTNKKKKKAKDYTAPGYFDKHMDEFYTPERLLELQREARNATAFFNRIGAKIVTE